ncbi:MAG: hypothetical protein Q7R41_17435 [Phycisphaerales bacterium]|nr:hypothetical protein [Phycisphaerales bacterium]
MLDSPLKYLTFLISFALVLGIPVGVVLGALGIQPLALALTFACVVFTVWVARELVRSIQVALSHGRRSDDAPHIP